jgi:putative oxidoreductase
MLRKILMSRAPSAVILIRIIVGAVFLSEGIQKFLYPEALGVGRFLRIGIAAPHFFAPFVATVEIIFGSMLLLGLLTRLAAVPLFITISVAIWTTKLPLLAAKGFWSMAHEARTDFAMLLGSLFLIIVGSGPISLDRRIISAMKKTPKG